MVTMIAFISGCGAVCVCASPSGDCVQQIENQTEAYVIIVTTENVTGHRTVRMLGQCFGVVVRSRGFAGEHAELKIRSLENRANPSLASLPLTLVDGEISRELVIVRTHRACSSAW